jgi:hypothetical protein
MNTKKQTMHITNGESVAQTLRVPGEIVIWRDVLCEGPVPRTTDDREFARVRAAYLASAGLTDYATALAGLEGFQAEMARYAEFDEVVIWCEYDLYDQVMLLRILEWLGRRDLGPTKISLIDAGTLLGKFTAEELARLLPGRQEVSAAQFALAREAWEAYTAEDPRAIVELMGRDTRALPSLYGALRRHLEEFPSARNGLSRTEETARRIWEERGPMDWRKLFVAVQAEEERPFLGDTSFQRIWTELQHDQRPERWLGGARADRWRWDGERLTAAE